MKQRTNQAVSLNKQSTEYKMLENEYIKKQGQQGDLTNRITKLYDACKYLSESSTSFPWNSKLLAVNGFLSWATGEMQKNKKFFDIFSRVILFKNNEMEWSSS